MSILWIGLKEFLTLTSTVLDIGSSSTTWPALILDTFGCKVYATEKALEVQKGLFEQSWLII
jgi:hypothetical protein